MDIFIFTAYKNIFLYVYSDKYRNYNDQYIFLIPSLKNKILQYSSILSCSFNFTPSYVYLFDMLYLLKHEYKCFY